MDYGILQQSNLSMLKTSNVACVRDLITVNINDKISRAVDDQKQD